MTTTVRSLKNWSTALILVAIVLLSFVFLMGCAKNDATSYLGEDPNAPRPKPLPAHCENAEFMNLDFTWTAQKPAAGYQLEFGFKGKTPFDIQEPDADTVIYSYPEARRGRSYTFKLTMQERNGRERSEVRDVYVPKCEEREDYQKKNPDYTEPISVWIFFPAR